MFLSQGGVEVGDVDKDAETVDIETGCNMTEEQANSVLSKLSVEKQRCALTRLPSSSARYPLFHFIFPFYLVCVLCVRRIVAPFIVALHKLYVDLHFTYLEINPIVVTDAGQIYILDLAAKLDQTADFACAKAWEGVEFPPPFGRQRLPEEEFISELDAKSGASLKVCYVFNLYHICISAILA